MGNRFRLTEPDGPGSSMHQTLGFFDTEQELRETLEMESDITELMVEDRDEKQSFTAAEFLER